MPHITKIVKRKLKKTIDRINAIKYQKKINAQEKNIEDKTKHVSMSIGELLMQENISSGFNRYDIIVRLLAIECEYGKNDFGWDLYKKMQAARVGREQLDNRVSNFINLIRSYETQGYDAHSEIELDINLHLIDGSHRIAMALFHNLPTINVKIRSYIDPVFYGIEWFLINNFSIEECEKITNRYNSIIEKINNPFVCTLWNPVFPFFEEITEKLKLFGDVKEIKDYTLSKHEYIFFTKGIYHVDDIATWKVEKKIECMTSDNIQTYHLRLVTLILKRPNFRLKESTDGTLSKKCELIKQLIRDAYKDKIDNYFYDIIIHIGDNFYQNLFLSRLMRMPKIDVVSILNNISCFNYVIVKSDTDYMPSDFPLNYPLGKDIDIICANPNEYRNVVKSIKDDVYNRSQEYDLKIIEKECFHTLIRIELQNCLILQFDVGCIFGTLPEQFSFDLCSTRMKKKNYFIPNYSKEIIVRMYEILHSPEKKHHIHYLQSHLSDIDKELCKKYYTPNDLRYLSHLVTGFVC